MYRSAIRLFVYAATLIVPCLAGAQEGHGQRDAVPSHTFRPGPPGKAEAPRPPSLEKLPADVTYRFRLNPPVAVYLPKRTIPALVRGEGDLTLRFEETKDPRVLSIRITDMKVGLMPFSFSYDVNGDGTWDALEFSGVEIGSKFLDLEKSTGRLDLDTGKMDLTFEYAITGKNIPMLEKLGGKEVRFPMIDRGMMDLNTGSFEIHGLQKIEEGPLKGALVRGGGGGDPPPPKPKSTVSLKVGIASSPIQCEQIPNDQKKVLVCAGDTILLCWTSSDDVKSVNMGPSPPGKSGLPRSGSVPFKVPPAGGLTQILIEVKTVGGNTDASDSVVVNYYQDGDIIGPFQAQPNPVQGGWSVTIPPTSISGRIMVTQVQIAPLSRACLQWRQFFFEHVPAFGPGTPDFGGNVGLTMTTTPPFPANGTWNFIAQPDPPKPTVPDPRGDNQLPVCFQFAGMCRSK